MPPARTATRAHCHPRAPQNASRTPNIIYTTNLYSDKILTNSVLSFLTNCRDNPLWGIIPPLKRQKTAQIPFFGETCRVKSYASHVKSVNLNVKLN